MNKITEKMVEYSLTREKTLRKTNNKLKQLNEIMLINWEERQIG